jgi:hypothetical protein
VHCQNVKKLDNCRKFNQNICEVEWGGDFDMGVSLSHRKAYDQDLEAVRTIFITI